jgi:small subunit ribosomal protein S8e
MAVWHGDKGRKHTGGEIVIRRKKRKYELGRQAIHVKIGKEKKFVLRTKGGGKKIRAMSVEFANVLDPATKKVQKTKILDVLENAANPQLVRSKIITKGAIIKTELGNARITSRPTQHGIVNAVIVEGKSKAE